MKREYIKDIRNLNIYDLYQTGNLNASLGELITEKVLTQELIPSGFALTKLALDHIFSINNLQSKINQILMNLDFKKFLEVSAASDAIVKQINKTLIPGDLESSLLYYYRKLNPNKVVIRPSIIERNLFKNKIKEVPETIVSVKGIDQVIKCVKQIICQTYSVPAILERHNLNLSQTDLQLSILIQEMVDSDVGESGTAMSREQKYGFENVIVVKGAYGMGDLMKKGGVRLDEFILHKPSLKKGLISIISKTVGKKETVSMLCKESLNSLTIKKTPSFMQDRFCISDKTALQIAKHVSEIEQYYSSKYGRDCRAEIEWAIDGPSQKLYIIDVKPQCLNAEIPQNVIRQITSSNLISSNKSAA